MGRAPCCQKVGLKRGRWTAEEDEMLTKYIQANGEGSWRSLPKNAGLLRCGKSCRLRWVNYLKQDLKRGNISPEEEKIIINLHANLGNRWSLIANQLSGRTDNEIKNYWNSHLSRKIDSFRRPLAPLNEELQAILERAKADANFPLKKKGGTASKLRGGNNAAPKGTSSKSEVSKPIDEPEAVAKFPTSCSEIATMVDGSHNVTPGEPDETGDDSEIINDGWMPASGGVTVSLETAGPLEGIDKDVILIDKTKVMDCDEILMKSHTNSSWDGYLVNISDGPTSPTSNACDGEILGPYEGIGNGIVLDINDIMDWDGLFKKSRTTCNWEDDLDNFSGGPTSPASGAISTCIVEAHNNVSSSPNITNTSLDDVGVMNDLEWEWLLQGCDEVMAPSCERSGEMLNWLWESGMNDDHRGDQDAFGSLPNFENDMITWLLS